MDGSIFISYRRGADSGFAGRLYDRLVPSFGRERVFMDVDSIAPGEDFVAVLKAHVAKCDVLLALIGRGWLNVTDGAGQRRLDNPEDFVRIEIAAALAQGKRVIPVVIDDAAMPRREDLPEEIKPLARRNATRLTHDRFKDDAERLVRALEKALAGAEAAGQVEEVARRKVEEEARQRRERERQRAEEEARQRAAAEAKRQAEDEERQRVERERQHAEAQAKRQAEEKDHRRTEEEAKRQGAGEKSSRSRPKWMIGGAILLAVGMGAIFLWPSPEQIPVPPVTAEKTAVTPSPSADFVWPSPEQIPVPPVTAEKTAVTPSRPADAEKAPEERALVPRTFRDCEMCPEMVALPGGTFLMGSRQGEEGRYSVEGPQHEVTIRPFAIGKYEVTFEEWDACVAAGGCNGYRPDDEGWGRGRRPVINVSWRDAQAYVDWLVKLTGKPYRLPSEAEWEYAARAGTTTRYAFGDEITGKDANFGGNVGKTTEVGAYPANPWGLYDVHGNVWEWVEDVWHDSYEGAPADGSAWTEGEGKQSSRSRVDRGGAWDNDPRNLRSANRNRIVPEVRFYFLGFRVARTLD